MKENSRVMMPLARRTEYNDIIHAIPATKHHSPTIGGFWETFRHIAHAPDTPKPSLLLMQVKETHIRAVH
jgi:hypothetical protein